MRARILIAVAVLAIGLVSGATAADAKKRHKHKRKGAVRVYPADITVVATTAPDLQSASGPVTGKPFGEGTHYATGTTTVNFTWTFRNGTVTGSSDSAGVRLLSGTGKFNKLKPAPLAVTYGISGMTVTYHLTGSVRY